MRSLAKFFVVVLNALMLSIVFSTSQAAFAQTYTFHQRTGASIVPGTTDTGNHCDDCTTTVALPFSYQLYGTTFNSANINSNGALEFSGNSGGVIGPTTLPDASFSDTIFPYLGDLDTGSFAAGITNGQGVFTSISGVAPNRVFNIEWRAVICCGPGAPDNIFEVRLFEGVQRFDIIYGSLTTTGDFETVGVQKDNTDFTLFESNTAGTLFTGLQLIVNTSPTAADSTIGGRITTSDGAVVAGTTVTLRGTQSRRAITDSNGNYHFDNVETNGFYTVTPSRGNYNFNPFNRSFSQIGNKTEAVFTATSTGDNGNPLDTAEYFVRQQYLDVLGREPEENGFNYWSDLILACGNDTGCTRLQRTGVAAAFFIEQEAQQTGSFIYDVYAGTLSRKPVYSEYSADRQLVVGGATLDAAKTTYSQNFVRRAEFVSKYQGARTADSFVNALIQSAQSSGVDLSGERANLIGTYNLGADMVTSRASVVRSLADNAAFKQGHYNRAFVLTEYFAYLRRDIDQAGYDFWVNVLSNGDVGNYRGMVCSFVTSREYQERFSSIISHDNGECAQ